MTKTDELMALAVKYQCSESPLKAARELRAAIEQALAEAAQIERERCAKARAVLQFFADIDLTTADVPANFAWYVLEARAIRKGEKT